MTTSQAVADGTAITTTKTGDVWFASTDRACGHTYRSEVAWNTAPAAHAHGMALAAKACSTCRDHASQQKP